MSTFVSGPINTVRLEGQVGNINKVLYLFFDDHRDVSYQSECPDIRAIEFKNYLIKNFDKTEQKIDFFMETYTIYGVFSTYTKYALQRKGNYLDTIRKFFQQNFNFDKETNKIHTSKEFPNVRLHYIDFRDLFFYDILFDKLPSIRNYFDTYCWNNRYIISQDIHFFQKELKYIDDRVNFLKQYIYSGKKFEGQKSPATELFDKIMNKVMNVYQNKDIHNKIKKYFKNEGVQIFEKYEKESTEFFNYLNFLDKKIKKNPNDKLNDINGYGLNIYKVVDEYLPTIWKSIYDIRSCIFDISVFIIDIFFLRRFLDKSYITNALIYTGAAHSCNYLYFLVKYCDFKITHTSYQKIPSEKLHNIIKESNNYTELIKYMSPQEFVQCSNLTGFPEQFA